MVKIDPVDLSFTAYTLPSGQGFPNELAFNSTQGYFTFFTSPGTVAAYTFMPLLVSQAIDRVSQALSVETAARILAQNVISQQVSVLSQNVSVISQKISVLSAVVSAQSVTLGARIDTVSQQVSVLSQQVSILSQNVSVLSQQTSVLSQNISVVSQALSVQAAALSIRIDTLSQQISVLSQAMSVISAGLGTVQKKVVADTQGVSATAATGIKISGLSISVAASGVYELNARLLYSTSGTVNVLGFGMSTSAATFGAVGGSWQAAISINNNTFTSACMVNGVFNTVASPQISCQPGATGTQLWAQMNATVVVSTTGGTIRLKARTSVSSYAINILKGSYFRAYKIL